MSRDHVWNNDDWRRVQELLAACKSLLALCEGGTGDALARMDEARKAIKRAEKGGQS